MRILAGVSFCEIWMGVDGWMDGCRSGGVSF
jgi:hypothetical protein